MISQVEAKSLATAPNESINLMYTLNDAFYVIATPEQAGLYMQKAAALGIAPVI